VATLAVQNFIQQGGELSYLLLHDPEYRARVRKQHLIQAGKGVRLKKNIRQLSDLLASAVPGFHFDFHVISAAPQEVIESALEGLIPASHIHGTQLQYDSSGQVESIIRVNAGYGKVAVLDDLQKHFQIGPERIIYVGDGGSDIHVMLHVNRREGFSIAVSQSRHIAPIAKRTVLSDDALSIMVPILEEIAGWDPLRIRTFFEEQGLFIQEWDRVRADWLTITAQPAASRARPEAVVSKQ
jgi:hypothetical protein